MVIDTGEGDMKEQILPLHDLAMKLRDRRIESWGVLVRADRGSDLNLTKKGSRLG
ncbi:MAG: hypothetical protein MZV63_62935 [Marinilabiliales bacterium]|nr:hypothetical protein [Marinilabiliales bacterium]